MAFYWCKQVQVEHVTLLLTFVDFKTAMEN